MVLVELKIMHSSLCMISSGRRMPVAVRWRPLTDPTQTILRPPSALVRSLPMFLQVSEDMFHSEEDGG